MRSSFFVYVYGTFETYLNDRCEMLRFGLDLPLKLADIDARDRGIHRARKYLTKLTTIQFPNTPEWSTINRYQKLRNIVVHSQGRLSFPCRDPHRQDLYQYILHHPHLGLVTDQALYIEDMSETYEEGRFIEFHKGFCEGVLATLQIFSTALDEATRDAEPKGNPNRFLTHPKDS